MKEKLTSHIIAVKVLVVFLVLGLACASEPEYIEIPPDHVTYSFLQIGHNFVTETRISIESNIFGIRGLSLLDTPQRLEVSVENLNEKLLKERIEYGKVYKIYCSRGNTGYNADRIDGLIPVEEAQAKIDKENAAKAAEIAERTAKEDARKVQEEQAKKTEQTRLANLYRQAGNNFGNLRNASRMHVNTTLYLVATYNFGDGNYIFEQRTTSSNFLDQALFNEQTIGTYRVNGDTVIFLSSNGNYSYGTIVGTALNINGDIYR